MDPVTRTPEASKIQNNSLSPPSQGIARLPSELHDYIIDHLYDDRRTLCACTLVCRKWNATSTYHLFQNASTVHVHRKNFPQFCQLLTSERLSAYIGRLSLESNSPFADGPDEKFQFNEHLQHFNGLSNLKHLHLYHHHERPLSSFVSSYSQDFEISVVYILQGYCDISGM
ncbi:hypothetical protein C8R44DRAFT_631565 [Mycena epipterygia]|nr:hypothetical protein C8R44DRAFT_631565 [Mycena epipterygia]